MAADARAVRVAIRTLGCKVNRAESEAVAESLLGHGVTLVDEAYADVIVVNSCTVTGEADAKTRKAVRRALSAPRRPVVVVTGCLAAVDPAGLEALGDRVVVEPDRESVARRVAEAGGRVSPLRSAEVGEAPAVRAAPRTRVTVKVQDGCDHRCTYCIVPDARGLPSSVPAADVVARVSALVASGTAEVVLTGVNIGRYADASSGAGDLAALVRAVAETGVSRIRISSIEPLDLTPRLVETLAALPAVMPHLHVPLQSGCDRTLAAMERGYDVAEYASAIGRARAALPGVAVTTDVIVGFPGETEVDHGESLGAVERLRFTRLHVFRYSRRAGTPAASLSSQVPAPEAAARARTMRALGERLGAAYARGRVGGTASVLVERISDGNATGTSEDYLTVHVRDVLPGVRPGDVLAVGLTAAERGEAWARPAEC